MIAKASKALTPLRHVLAVMIVGSAGAMVAGSVDVAAAHSQTSTTVGALQTLTQNPTNVELDEYVKACLASKDARSPECMRAIEKSGMSVEDFWPTVAMSVGRTTSNTMNSTQFSTRDLLSLVSACVASHERSSKYCEKARELSGLSADDFWAKVGPLFTKTSSDQVQVAKSTTRPSEKPATPNNALYGLVTACLNKYEHAKDSPEGPAQASEACRRAIEASGLTSEEFWKRFAPKRDTTTKPEPTRKPEQTRKPEMTAGVTSAQLELLVKDCFAKYLAAKNSGGSSEAGSAAGEACRKAIAASGLTPEAFFRRFGTPGSS